MTKNRVLVNRQGTHVRLILDLVRHAVPLVQFYVFGGAIELLLQHRIEPGFGVVDAEALVAAAARRYLRELRRIRPSGPYLLGTLRGRRVAFLARNSDLIPQDAFDTAKMDEWLFWAQYNHEPYIAVARFQIAFLGKSPSDLNPDLFTRGYAALQRMDDVLRGQDFLVACGFSLADIALVAYTRMAQEENFDLTRYPAVQRWIGVVEEHLGLDPYITMTGS